MPRSVNSVASRKRGREKRSTVSVSNEQSTGADHDDMRKFEN